MKSLGKISMNLANGTNQVHSMADKTLIRFTGAGSCKVQAAWDEAEGYSYAELKDLSANIVVVIDSPIKYIKISSANGAGKVIVEGYN